MAMWLRSASVLARRGSSYARAVASSQLAAPTTTSRIAPLFTREFSQVGHGSGGRDGGLNIREPPASLPYSVRGLNHIAIAVPDLNAASEFYRTVFGAQVSEPHTLPEHGVTVVIAQVSNFTVELLYPYGEKSPIAKFLEKNPRGGLHHLCFTVDDIDAASKHAASEGVRVLGDGKPRIGAHNNPVLFLDPRDNLGVLCEFEQVSCAEPLKGSE